MSQIDTDDFRFKVDENPDDPYKRIGICERFGFGFIQQNSGYIGSIFGPEIYDVKNKHNLDEEKLIGLHTNSRSTFYYPDNSIDEYHGAVDIHFDGEVFRYKESGSKTDTTDMVIMKCRTASYDNEPIVFEKDELSSMLKSGEVVALWPLIKKANR